LDNHGIIWEVIATILFVLIMLALVGVPDIA
jgi:hypothetical protein